MSERNPGPVLKQKLPFHVENETPGCLPALSVMKGQNLEGKKKRSNPLLYFIPGVLSAGV